jgi:hypothetical protein
MRISRTKYSIIQAFIFLLLIGAFLYIYVSIAGNIEEKSAHVKQKQHSAIKLQNSNS